MSHLLTSEGTRSRAAIGLRHVVPAPSGASDRRVGSTSSVFSEVAEDRAPSTFQDNFVRLLGLHGLRQHFTAQLLGVSEATMSAWINGKATPSLAKAIDIAELFRSRPIG